jgi:rhodanese-related sulfurtransferase
MGLRALRVAAIVVGGCVLGLCWNAVSGRGFALDQSVLLQAGDEVIPAPEAKRRLDRGALFLDARPRAFWEMNRIEGALPLPQDDFQAAFDELEPKLRDSLDIVVYCSGYGCEASHIVARELADRGVHAAVLDEGIPAWEDAGYALVEVAP